MFLGQSIHDTKSQETNDVSTDIRDWRRATVTYIDDAGIEQTAVATEVPDGSVFTDKNGVEWTKKTELNPTVKIFNQNAEPYLELFVHKPGIEDNRVMRWANQAARLTSAL